MSNFLAERVFFVIGDYIGTILTSLYLVAALVWIDADDWSVPAQIRIVTHLLMCTSLGTTSWAIFKGLEYLFLFSREPTDTERLAAVCVGEEETEGNQKCHRQVSLGYWYGVILGAFTARCLASSFLLIPGSGFQLAILTIFALKMGLMTTFLAISTRLNSFPDDIVDDIDVSDGELGYVYSLMPRTV